MASDIESGPDAAIDDSSDSNVLSVGLWLRGLLGYFGCQVGLFWIGLGVLPTIDIWGDPLINLTQAEWLPLAGGVVLVVWSLLGAIRPTKLRFIPPAVVAFPLGIYALFLIVGQWARYRGSG